MYNKIFTKILDSSIWMEPTATRIVWVTMLAAMDEDGFVQFAGIPNLAHRAVLELGETAEAVRILESPDSNSSDPENEGRRIERVQGGWLVLNAPKYRDLVTRVAIREQTRLRVKKYRAKNNIKATKCNGRVTHRKRKANDAVAQSDTDTDTDTKTVTSPVGEVRVTAEQIYSAYPRRVAKPDALKAIAKAMGSPPKGFDAGNWPRELLAIVERYASLRKSEPVQFTPHPATWFNQERYNDDPSTWKDSDYGNHRPTHRPAAIVSRNTDELPADRPDLNATAWKPPVGVQDARRSGA